MVIPTSISAMGKVAPWILCMVMAHASRSGICEMANVGYSSDCQYFMGICRVTPLENRTTGMGIPACCTKSAMIPIEPLHIPLSMSKFTVHITLAPFFSCKKRSHGQLVIKYSSSCSVRLGFRSFLHFANTSYPRGLLASTYDTQSFL